MLTRISVTANTPPSPSPSGSLEGVGAIARRGSGRLEAVDLVGMPVAARREGLSVSSGFPSSHVLFA